MCTQSVTVTSLLFTQLSLHSLIVVLIFTIFSHFSFRIHYGIEDVVHQNTLTVTSQHTSVKPTQQYERANASLT